MLTDTFKRDFEKMMDALCEALYHASVDKGFYEDEKELLRELYVTAGAPTYIAQYTINLIKSQKLMLIVSELAEALEGIRGKLLDEHLPEYHSLTVELADTVIRICDFCGHYQLPLGEAIVAKMEFNATRPHKHGKEF